MNALRMKLIAASAVLALLAPGLAHAQYWRGYGWGYRYAWPYPYAYAPVFAAPFYGGWYRPLYRPPVVYAVPPPIADPAPAYPPPYAAPPPPYGADWRATPPRRLARPAPARDVHPAASRAVPVLRPAPKSPEPPTPSHDLYPPERSGY